MPTVEGDTIDTSMGELLDALEFIDPTTLTQDEWLNCMMAWHYEGGDYFTFDAWSFQDAERYNADKNAKRWDSITDDNPKPTTGKTIFKLAYERGWRGAKASSTTTQARPRTNDAAKPKKPEVPIVRKLESSDQVDERWDERESDMMREQLSAMFEDGDLVNIVTKWTDRKGKPEPSGYGQTLTAAEFIQHVEDTLAQVD